MYLLYIEWIKSLFQCFHVCVYTLEIVTMFECLEAVATDAHKSHNEEQSQVLATPILSLTNNCANNQKLNKNQGKLFGSLWLIVCRCKHTSQISQLAPQTGYTGVETKRGQRFWWKCLNDKLSRLKYKRQRPNLQSSRDNETKHLKRAGHPTFTNLPPWNLPSAGVLLITPTQRRPHVHARHAATNSLNHRVVMHACFSAGMAFIYVLMKSDWSDLYYFIPHP